MQLVFVSVLFFLFLCRNIDAAGQTLYPTAAGGVGAVYTMSNGAMMNQILIQRINANGQLSTAGMINTNGTGVNTTSPDALASQGALTTCSNYLFSVNPGSNSLSMFWINPADATQLTLVSVQATLGSFPVSVAVNNMYACVLTGGSTTGIRCFTFNSSGLYVVPSFDRNLTSYISQTVPPMGLANTMSQISFSADNLSLIVVVKGVNSTMPGYLLFLLLTNSYSTLSNPIKMIPTGAVYPFSITLVGTIGAVIPDANSNGVITLTYSSTSGTTNNYMTTILNSSLASALCWSAYSPTIGNYYIIGGSGGIVELSINLGSNTNSVQIVQYFQTPTTDGALDATVVTLAGKDYLYVIGATAYVVDGFTLNAAGNATLNNRITAQGGNNTNIPALAGMAAFVQTQSSTTMTTTTQKTSSSVSLFASTVTLMICMIFIYFGRV